MANKKKEKKIICDRRSGIRRKFVKMLFFLFLTAPTFFFGISGAEAATLYFSPASGSYKIGQNFSVNIYVSSADQAANAYLGTVSFPADKLQASSVSKSGSIVNLWVQDPVVSSGGTVNFEGITLNPGFTGSAGKIITINFKVLAVGTAAVNFTAGTVLANDGQGTNILSGLGSAAFTLAVAGEAVPPTEEKMREIVGLPEAPAVTSPNLPDSTKWYNNNNPEFSWPLPRGITGVSMLIDKNPTSDPGAVSDGLFSLHTQKAVEDGMGYFHLRLRNSKGWGYTTHFRFQVDTKPPEPFSVVFVDGKESENPRPRVLLKTTDAASGIDYYQMEIDSNDPFVVTAKELETGFYTLPSQSSGKHTIVVQVFDQAGNSAGASEEFIIEKLAAPEITEYPHELNSGDILVLKGKTYPNTQVTVWLQRNSTDIKNQTVRSNQRGDFTMVVEGRVAAGIYKMWAEVMDEQMRRSDPSEPITLAVQQSLFGRITSRMLSYMAVLVPLLALFLLFLILSHRIMKKLADLKRHLRRDVHEIERDLHRAFSNLREEVSKEIGLLEKAKSERNLTREEENITKRLKEELTKAEKHVAKKIERLEDEIK